MLTSSRVPQDHFVSAGLNNFFTTNNLKSGLKAGAISYFAISTSNNIARKDYKNALISGLCGIVTNNILGDNMSKNPYINDNNYGAGYGMGFDRANCPYNPYLNENYQNYGRMNNYNNGFNNGFNNGGNGFFRNLTNQGNGFLGNPMVKGILIGAAIAYLLSNKEAKDTLAKGVAKLQNFASAAVEEFKEQIEDAKANMQD